MHAQNFGALVMLALVAAGCRGTGKESIAIPDSRGISGENREWWDIYSEDQQGDRKVRTKVGSLYRKFGPEDPTGKYWVEDLGQHKVGFLLADFQAFQILPPSPGRTELRAVPVGTTDLLGGIKRILQVPGTVKLEKVTLPKG